MVKMSKGDPLKHVHDALGIIIDGLKELTTSLSNIKEQLHLIDNCQTILKLDSIGESKTKED
jgi:hypothetical protein